MSPNCKFISIIGVVLLCLATYPTISFGQKRQYKKALRANNVRTYLTFLSQFPNSEYSDEISTSLTNAFSKSTENKANVCISIAFNIENDRIGLSDNMDIVLTFINNQANDTVKITIEKFRKALDNNRYFYLPIEDGSYYLAHLGTVKTLGNTGALQIAMLGDVDWDLGVVFSSKEPTKMSSGDIVYMGSYFLEGQVEKERYFFTGLKIDDTFQDAKGDLSKFYNNSNSMIKRQGLREDMDRAEKRF